VVPAEVILQLGPEGEPQLAVGTLVDSIDRHAVIVARPPWREEGSYDPAAAPLVPSRMPVV
jgi:hypothetical protein